MFLRNAGYDDRFLNASIPREERRPQEGRHGVAGPVGGVVPLVSVGVQADRGLEVHVQLEGRVVIH